eukprot:gene27283-33601_t
MYGGMYVGVVYMLDIWLYESVSQIDPSLSTQILHTNNLCARVYNMAACIATNNNGLTLGVESRANQALALRRVWCLFEILKTVTSDATLRTMFTCPVQSHMTIYAVLVVAGRFTGAVDIQ